MSDRADSSGLGRTAAGAVYVLFMLAPFTGGLTALAGWVVTLFTKAGAEAQPREHMNRQGRLFWTALILILPVALLSFIGEIPILGIPFAILGWVLGFLICAWFVLTSFFGLLRLQRGQPSKG